jgi:hypothetical protein
MVCSHSQDQGAGKYTNIAGILLPARVDKALEEDSSLNTVIVLGDLHRLNPHHPILLKLFQKQEQPILATTLLVGTNKLTTSAKYNIIRHLVTRIGYFHHTPTHIAQKHKVKALPGQTPKNVLW